MNVVTVHLQALNAAYRAAMHQFASTVTIIKAVHYERSHSMTATAVISLSMDPPLLLICVHRKILLHDTMFRARRFCMNVLHSEQLAVSAALRGAVLQAQRSKRGTSSVGGRRSLYRGRAGEPVLPQGRRPPYVTHTVVAGNVEHLGVRDAPAPLVYQDAGYCVTNLA